MKRLSDDDLIGAIYDAALEPARWAGLLRDMADSFGGSAAFVVVRERNHTRVLGAEHRLAALRDYNLHWEGRNPLEPLSAAQPAGKVFTERMLMPAEALVRTDYYNGWMLPHDVPNLMGAKLWAGPSAVAQLNLAREGRASPFEEKDIARARRLVPHVQRALGVTRQLSGATFAARRDFSVLDGLSVAALVLDQRGRPIHANAAAQALLRSNDGVRLSRSGLQCEDAVLHAAFAKLTAQAAIGDGQGRRVGGGLVITRPSGGRAYALTATPIGSDLDWLLPVRPRVLVTIVDPEDRLALPPERLGSMYRLTPSERIVAIGLARGLDLAQVAEGAKLTTDSARQYLQRVFRKTGTHRQAELVRLLALLSVSADR